MFLLLLMLTISSPLSAGHAQRYFSKEFTNKRGEYYSEGRTVAGHWQGRLAQAWQLEGEEVRADQFARLAGGHHPTTDEELVRYRQNHRAGHDFSFSAPKSVSVTALVGKDARVRQAHEAAVTVAMRDAVEPAAQARVSSHASETTGKLMYARFEHDSSRPIQGQAGAPQLHTHNFVANVQQTENGDTWSLQSRGLFRTSAYATAVYRSELALQLQALNYRVERGPYNEPEIIGYTQEYLDASSPRTAQIHERAKLAGFDNPEARLIATLETREKKIDLAPEEVDRQQQAIAAAYGYQARSVVEGSQGPQHQHTPSMSAAAALDYATEKHFERNAVVDRDALKTDALIRSLGDQSSASINAEFHRRIESGALIEVGDHQYTTPQMQALEYSNIVKVQAGQHTQPPLAAADIRRDVQDHYAHLSDHQKEAVENILKNTDQVQGLQGYAGVGKTTTLAAVRDAAEREHYHVQGMAPTSKATAELRDAGIPSKTLQMHLAQPQAEHKTTLYVVDESSLASTKQVSAFLERLQPTDRVLLVGDVRQHQSVDAGAVFEQLQDHGLHTTRLEQIVRQQDPELRGIVEQLSRGEVASAVAQLDARGNVHEIVNREDRYQAIAAEYVKHHESTLVVSPDNQSRRELNAVIHAEMQNAGHVSPEEHTVKVLVTRQELTGADRAWASKYQVGDIVRFSKRSQAIAAGSYGTVERVDARHNQLTVRTDDGTTHTYDARRRSGVAVYKQESRLMSAGDRVQFTSPDKLLGVANRDMATVARIDKAGLHVQLDDGRKITVAGERNTLDLGYAVTSHSSQGTTVDRVIVHADTTAHTEARFAYVAVSRARYSAEVYTDSRQRLPAALSRDVGHAVALQPEAAPAPRQAPAFVPWRQALDAGRQALGHG